MPRPNQVRSVGSERALARRIAMLCEERGWKYPELAERMAAAGCPIQVSALYKIHGDPPRRVTLDEAITLANVFDVPIDELVVPTELVLQKRAMEVAAQIPAAYTAYDEAVLNGLRVYLEYGQLAAESPELLEYMNFQMDPHWDNERQRERYGVELGPGVSEQEIKALRRDVVDLWGKVLRLASKAAKDGA